MKLYEGDHFRCFAPDQCCLFCKKCSDIFYDFQGPYMFICIEGHSGDWETCGAFEMEEDHNA